jgi:hypothetical protein
LDDDYSSWQHIRRTGTLLIGEGFTMKGPGTGSILTDQNYVFKGKPNNGDIGFSGTNDLDLAAGNDYLVGNPYPSAIDAVQFINDNGSTITGTLYFWEHWGGGNHNLQDYQGGYATMNLSGGLPSPAFGTSDPDVSTAGSPVKRPGQYIPVSQGFFVVADTGGKINFNNGQRVFYKENASLTGNSVFVRLAETSEENSTGTSLTSDDRMKIRLGFNSINTIRRQLLLTVDPHATTGIDWGYDGKLNDEQMDDLFWMIDNQKHIIQGTSPIDINSVFPLGIKTDSDGLNTITIDEIENSHSGLTLYVHDKDLDTYHNLSESDFQFYLPAGEYLNKFEITFTTDQSLGVDDTNLDKFKVYYSNTLESIVLVNPTQTEIEKIEMFNILGQSIATIKDISGSSYSEYEVKNLSTGTYIIKLHTVSGSVSKKVLVK